MVALSVRHEVLKRLGLKQWYSKYNLPNAADTPSSVFASRLDVGSDESMSFKSSDDNTIPVDEVASSLELSSGKDLLKEMLLSEEPLSGQLDTRNVGAISDAPTGLAASIEFAERMPSLSLSVRFYNKVIVFYECDPSGDLELEHRLIENIFKSFNQDTELLLTKKVFKWPVFQSEVLASSQELFFDKILSRWAADKKWSQVSHILYFGQNYEKLKAVLLGVRQEFNEASTFVPYAFSLADLANMPSAKKNLWSLLIEAGLGSE